jgi:dipeptidyl aminopeptidase/acylaminoacyl peptidase
LIFHVIVWLRRTVKVWLSRHHEVWRVNLASGAAAPLWKKAQEAPPVSRYWNERAYDESNGLLYTVHESSDGRVTLFCTQLEQGVTQAVTTLWQGVGELEVGPIRYLSWNLADGTACGGSLLLPVTWKEGDKPPVVMSVYGDDRGKGALNSTRFHDASYIINPHLLSAQGYAVFVPDMPQTDEAPLQSLITAGEAAAGALEASGLVDIQRVAVMGSSYGGYTTLCMLIGSKRFKTGIICNGVYDMARVASDGGWGYVEAGQGRMRASLWQQPERYHENSPFYRLDQLEVPLLIVSGGGDNQGKEHDRTVFNALQRLEKPVELLAYSHQGHVPTSWTIAAQRDLHQRILAFFVTHLGS